MERYEAELKRYRSQAFNENAFQCLRLYSKELVEILKKGSTLDSYRILERLGIDSRESELVKAVSKHQEELEDYGMVKSDGMSWRWIG